MDEAAKIYRYANDILPQMDIEELMDQLSQAAVANEYGSKVRQIQLIREEIIRRVK